MENLLNAKERIAGEIALSDTPGSVMKKWRALFGITQSELSKQIKISASTISDYESNRRLSPGVVVIKRFVDALFIIDREKGGNITKSLERFANTDDSKENDVYTIYDFSAPISGVDFARIIDGKIITNQSYLDSIQIFGCTEIDSIKVILDMQPSEYPKLFGSTSERAFLFKHVTTGRSPMVVIRTAPIKPKIAVMHNLTTVDKLAIKLAQADRIPLITTKLDLEEIKKRLMKI